MSKFLSAVFKMILSKLNLMCVCFILYNLRVYAQDLTNISEIDDLLQSGQSMIKVAAKWGGILTVVGAALALGRGRLEGALAQTICKILIVVGLLVAAFSYFGNKISWGFTF